MDTVLVVEDSRPDATDLAASVRIRRAAGTHRVRRRRRAGIFSKTVPNVVVLDLKLPRLPGKELCRAFKSSGGLCTGRGAERKCRCRRQSASSGTRRGRLRHEAFQPQRVARPRAAGDAPRRTESPKRREIRHGSRPQHELLAVQQYQNRLYEYGGNARGKAGYADGTGIQAAEVFCRFAGRGDFARKAS